MQYAIELRSKAGQPGYRMSKTYRQIKRVTLKSCIGECYRESTRCKSINFNRETYECQLSDQSNTKLLEPLKQWQYIEVQLGEFCSKRKEKKTSSLRHSTTPKLTATPKLSTSPKQSLTTGKELPKDATTTPQSIRKSRTHVDVTQHMSTFSKKSNPTTPSTSGISSEVPLSTPLKSSKNVLKSTYSGTISTINPFDISQEMFSIKSSAKMFSQQEIDISSADIDSLIINIKSTSSQSTVALSTTEIGIIETTEKTSSTFSSTVFGTSATMTPSMSTLSDTDNSTSAIETEVTYLKTTTEITTTSTLSSNPLPTSLLTTTPKKTSTEENKPTMETTPVTRVPNICFTACVNNWLRIETTFTLANGENTNIHCFCHTGNDRLTIFRGNRDLSSILTEDDILNGYYFDDDNYWIGRKNVSRLIKEMDFEKIRIRRNGTNLDPCDIVSISADTEELQVDSTCDIPQPFTFGTWSKCHDDTWWWGCDQNSFLKKSVFNNNPSGKYALYLI